MEDIILQHYSPTLALASNTSLVLHWHLSVTPHIHSSEIFHHIIQPSYPRSAPFSAFIDLRPQHFLWHPSAVGDVAIVFVEPV